MNRAILVKSCERFKARMDACIDTWVQPIRFDYGVPIYFAIGGHDFTHMGGEFLFLNTPDNYSANSWKVRDAIFVLLSHHDFTHLFICDDDTFVHPKRWLAHEPEGDLECRLFHPQTDKQKRQNDGQPWIHGGAGWWMSRRMCELYVKNCEVRTSADDVVAARIAQNHGIEIIDRPDLYGNDEYGGKLERVAADNTLITCHHVQPNEMVKLWEGTRGL